MNNKTLALILGALVLVYVASKIFGGNKERSFDSNVIAIDANSIDKINVTQSDETFSLQKNGDGWSLKVDNNTYTATENSVQTLIENLADVNAQRIVSKTPEKWVNYEVAESDPRIELFSGSKKLVDVRAGRFSFDQVSRSGTSYIRLEGADEVYAISGFSSMTLRQNSDNYRDKSMLTFTPANVQGINISGTSLSKVNGNWQTNEKVLLDSTEMANYLNGISNTSGASFATITASQLPNAFESLQINDGNREMEIRAYADTSANNDFFIQTSENTEGIFSSDSTGVYQRLFSKLYDILK